MVIDPETKFSLSSALREKLLINDESIVQQLKRLKASDLQDTKDASISMQVRNGWTGMRVSYDMVFFNKGVKVTTIRGCSHAPWQTVHLQ